jgi:rhodanese-related sulfurtransferase
MHQTAADLVARANASVERLSPEEVAVELTAGGVLLVDVREPAELTEQGRIPGSVWVPRGLLEFRADPTHPRHHVGFEPTRRVIVHCADGERSALAAATLRGMGYGRVAHLDGGLAAWKRKGNPVR